MENPHKEQLDTLARWVSESINKGGVDLSTCPTVGWLGWANGMSYNEWLAVNQAKDIITKAGGDWHDYFTYNVDSSD